MEFIQGNIEGNIYCMSYNNIFSAVFSGADYKLDKEILVWEEKYLSIDI